MDYKMKINLVLLAAGNSRRYGSNKLLYELDGKPMYRHVVDEITRLGGECDALDEKAVSGARIFCEKIVVSQYDGILEDLAMEGWTVVRNTEPELGISKSLQLGISGSQTRADAWCFVVADQPYLKAETIEGLVQGFLHAFLKDGKTCGCVKCGERMGNPCIFTRVHEEELMNLTGDVGGKKVLMRHLKECFFWETEEERELEDVDVKNSLDC